MIAREDINGYRRTCGKSVSHAVSSFIIHEVILKEVACNKHKINLQLGSHAHELPCRVDAGLADMWRHIRHATRLHPNLPICGVEKRHQFYHHPK
jgi:hypothetical protein